ncbi:stage III sporulation protein AC [Desulfurispora thermophila]|uniref:stage III sporulation protein AC n=1 Tax=Desulfurispora thermophila TaxID=265470 RepID=UPI00037FDB44|nr:stage III sporulation protein AC [Desulfurispora thermophila]
MGSNIDLIFKIAGVGILVAAAHWVLKSAGKEDYAFITTLGGVAIVLMWVIYQLGNLFEQVKSVFRLF